MNFLNLKMCFIVCLVLKYCEGELITIGITLAATALFGYNYNQIVDNTYCKVTECCNADYLPFNMNKFKADMQNKLIGQPLVMQLSSILEGHLATTKKGANEKPLVLSFHGWTGVGKNYVLSILADAFYKKSLESKYVKMYVGEHHFPKASMVAEYKEQLKKEVSAIVRSCPTAMIIFNEVHKMPQGVLDAVMPMMDHYTSLDGVDYRRSIFVFMSNIGSEIIGQRLLKLYDNGYTRQDTTMAYFEPSIRDAAYNMGGFREAALVFHHLIDHYIPFLPLEQVHLEECVRRAFAVRGLDNPTPEMINEVMSINTYGPTKAKPIFVNAGCKRVLQQVNKVIASHLESERGNL